MRIRQHRNYGHGLTLGTDHDINCRECQRDRAAGVAPVITGSEDPGRSPGHVHTFADLAGVQRVTSDARDCDQCGIMRASEDRS